MWEISASRWFSFKKFITFHSKYLEVPPSVSFHIATRVRRLRVVRLSWSSRFFMQVAASKMRASNSSGVSTFVLSTSLSMQPHKQICNGIRFIQTAVWRYPFKKKLQVTVHSTFLLGCFYLWYSACCKILIYLVLLLVLSCLVCNCCWLAVCIVVVILCVFVVYCVCIVVVFFFLL